jgi:hypothetical protein
MIRTRNMEYKIRFIPERSPIFSSLVSLERTVSGSKASEEAGGVGGALLGIFSLSGFVSEEFTEAESWTQKLRSFMNQNIDSQ